MHETEFEQLRALARRFDRAATDAQRMQSESAPGAVDVRQYFEGKREAYANAAYLLRGALDASGVSS
jgi:hypothetical protein